MTTSPPASEGEEEYASRPPPTTSASSQSLDARKAKRVLQPSIPRRKTSRSNNYSPLWPNTTSSLSQAVALAAQARITAQDDGKDTTTASGSSRPSFETQSPQIDTPRTADLPSESPTFQHPEPATAGAGEGIPATRHSKQSSVASSRLSVRSWGDYAALVSEGDRRQALTQEYNASAEGNSTSPGLLIPAAERGLAEDLDTPSRSRSRGWQASPKAQLESGEADPHPSAVKGLGIGNVKSESSSSAIPLKPDLTSPARLASPQEVRTTGSDGRRRRQESFGGFTTASRHTSQASSRSSAASLDDNGIMIRMSKSPSEQALTLTPATSFFSGTPRMHAGSSSATSSPAIGSTVARRKGKPTNLAIGPASPIAGLSKGLASPIARGRTPPPTNPPAEPLPPLPVSASFLVKPTRFFPDDQAPASTSPRERKETLRRSDSSQTGAPILRGSFDSQRPAIASIMLQQALGTNAQTSPTSSSVGSRPVNSAAESKAAAVVASNHRETLAGAESAQAVLRTMQPVTTFDESQGRSQHNHAEDTNHMNGSHSGRADTNREVDNAVDEDENEEDDGGGPEEDEVAVVRKGTLVHSVRASGTQQALSPPARPITREEASLQRNGSVHRAEKVDLNKLARVRDRGSAVDPVTKLSTSVSSHEQVAQNDVRQSSPDIDVSPQISRPNSNTPASSIKAASRLLSAKPGQESDTEPVATVRSESRLETASDSQSTATAGDSSLRDVSLPAAHVGDAKSKAGDSRFTGTFGEIATAFKQLQAEKRTLEKVIRATTPLAGLGDNGEDFVKYLTTMNDKLQLSAGEIRKLLDLLERQRATMDYMLEIHQAELDSHLDDNDDLRDELDEALEMLESVKSKNTRLAQENVALQQEALSAKEELAQARSSLADEGAKREKAIVALEAARDGLQAAERRKTDALARERHLSASVETLQNRLASMQAAHDGHLNRANDLAVKLEAAKGAHETEISTMGASHEKEIWDLQESHETALADHNSEIEQAAAKLMETHSEALEILRDEHAETIEELQARIAALESGQEASLQAKRELMEAVDLKDDQIAELKHHLSVADKARGELEAKLDARDADQEVLQHSVDSHIDSNGEDLHSLPLRGREGSIEDSSVGTPTTPTFGPKASTSTSLSGSPAEQVKALQAQLHEQKTRESQIRSAYKLLRDQHRRLQNSHKEIAERSARTTPGGGSFSLGTPSARQLDDESGHNGLPATPGQFASPGHTGSYFSGANISPVTPLSGQPGTARTLKRLSLPLATAVGSSAGAAQGGFPEHIANVLASGVAVAKSRSGDHPIAHLSSHPPNSWRGSFTGHSSNGPRPSSPSSYHSSTGSDTLSGPAFVGGSSGGSNNIGYVGRGYIASSNNAGGTASTTST